MDKYKEKILMLEKISRIDTEKHLLVITHARDCPFIQKTGECNCVASIQAILKKTMIQCVSEALKTQVAIEEGFEILHGQAVNGSTYYEPPETNLNCLCYPSMMRAMFCTQGHLTECHVGKNCLEAKCSHLSKYQ